MKEEFKNNYKFEYDIYSKKKSNPLLWQIVNNYINNIENDKSNSIKSLRNSKSKDFNTCFNFFPPSSRAALISFFNNLNSEINIDFINEDKRDKCIELAITTINNKSILQKISSLITGEIQTKELLAKLESIKNEKFKNTQAFNSDSYIECVNHLFEKLKENLYRYLNTNISIIKDQNFFLKFLNDSKNRLISHKKENLERIKFIEILKNEFDKNINKKEIDLIEFNFYQSNKYYIEEIYYDNVIEEPYIQFMR